MMVGGIWSLHVALQQQLPRLLSAYPGGHACLISSKPARLRTDSRILGMSRRHIIRLQMLSIPFTTKQRWTDDTRASIDNRSPEAPRVQRSGNQRNCSTDWNSSMTPHETALVTTLLERLKKTDSPDKDFRSRGADPPDY